ncbi:MAG: ADOP family duplicated permease [Acidobacteriota bacterium]
MGAFQRIANLFRLGRLNREIDAELESHVAMRTEENIAQGMTPEEARREALLRFGSRAAMHERVTAQDASLLLEAFFRNVRFALRQLKRSPGFSITAILTLAFGIGATSAIFSVVDGVLLRPLPFPTASRLVTLGDQVRGGQMGKNGDAGWVTAPEVVTYQHDTRSFESLGGFTHEDYELSAVGQPARIVAARMTPSVFSVLRVAPYLGRVFTAEEDTQKAQVVVLSYATWKTRFNANPRVIGTKIDLNRRPYTVIGVMPETFAFPINPGSINRCELWIPISFSADELSPEQEGYFNFRMVGRLKAGVTMAQAQDDARRVAARIMSNYPRDLSGLHIRPVVYPLHAIEVERTRPLLNMLFMAVAVVLLIACANLAGLLLVRAIRRQRETAVRLALGAQARTLLGQTMLESLVISGTGGALGIGLAAVALAIGKDYLPADLPLTNQIAMNWTVAGFALLLALLTGVLCGLAPGFAALRTNVNASLKDGGRSGWAGTHARLRSALVVAEIAIALILLCASGLFLRSYLNMSDVDLGFQPDHVTAAAYALPAKKYPAQDKIETFNSQVFLRLRQLPGVQSVGMASTIPTRNDCCEAFTAEGYVNPRGSGWITAAYSEVIGDFFRVMGIPLLRGRYFTDADNANGQLVVIVNHEFAEHYWPNQNPIGKHMRIGISRSRLPWMTVVGEVANVTVGSPDTGAAAEFYQPMAQVDKDLGGPFTPHDRWGDSGYIVVRSTLPPAQMENSVRAVVRTIDPQLPLSHVQTMQQAVSQSEASRRFNTVIISSFAVAAVLLAVLGIYSVVAFSVASRVQEMAIRMALGSQRKDIVRLILASGLKLAALGAVAGLVGAAVASRVLRSFLFHVSPFDPVVMALTAAAVFALALVASALPALRAASVDPMRALRNE